MTIRSEDRAKLVALARETIEAVVTGRSVPKVVQASGILTEQRGCFVTLSNRGKLRGCVGTFRPSAPLGEMTIQMAAAAARDPRFVSNPVVSFELPELTVEVSVLSPLTETDEPEKLQVGKHGIYIVSGERSGCFLPEVATEMGWDAEEFLSHCCTGKAGLEPDAWRQADTKLYLFTSEKFDH